MRKRTVTLDFPWAGLYWWSTMWAKLLCFYSLIPFCFCILLSFYPVIFWYFFFPCAGVDSGRALRQKLNSKLGNCLTDCGSNHCGYRRYLYHQGNEQTTGAFLNIVAITPLGAAPAGFAQQCPRFPLPRLETHFPNVSFRLAPGTWLSVGEPDYW